MNQAEEGHLRVIHGSTSKKPPAISAAAALGAAACETSSSALTAPRALPRIRYAAVTPASHGHPPRWILSAGAPSVPAFRFDKRFKSLWIDASAGAQASYFNPK